MTRILTAIAPGPPLAALLAALLAACPPTPDPVSKLAERYCYRTLAEVDCHAQPLRSGAERKVGFFDPAILY